MTIILIVFLLVVITVLAVALLKKNKVENTSEKEISEEIKKEPEEESSQDILLRYVYKRFDEFLKTCYKDNLLRWETPSDLRRGLSRASIPVKVYFTNGTYETIRVFTNLETKISDEDDGFRADARLTLKQIIPVTTTQNKTEKAPEKKPKSEPKKSPKKPKEDKVLTAEEWWKKNMEKVLKMEKIILSKDILPEELKEEVANIMLNSQLFDNVLSDEDGVFATLA